jgi:TPR repeat protein
MNRVFLAALLTLCLVGPARADFQAGLAAHERGDREIALREWTPLAESGNAEAQYYLWVLHLDESHAEALKWLLDAAGAGHPKALYDLAALYDKGLGMERDDAKAAALYRRAAEQGHADAQARLAAFHAEGRGLAADPVRAYHWYTLALDGGAEGAAQARQRLAAAMSAAQIATAVKLTRDWRPQ